MVIAIEPLEVLSDRWADHTENAAKVFLRSDSTHQQILLGHALSLTLPGGLM